MAKIRSEDQIFFIFNHQALTCEEDELKNAIVYFFPSSVSTNDQCDLVGQLMGLVDFFKSFSGSPPLIYTLEKNKVAIKHLGKYTMALSGNRTEPDGVVITQLNYLYSMFVFFNGSLQRLEEKHRGNTTAISSAMQDIWDCYLPFVRRYGDNIAAAFDSLPVLDLPEPRSMLFLKASHLLQDCQTIKNTIAGCILYKQRVLCSQLHPNITAKLLIIQPQQTHIPCESVKAGTTCPEGVRLINVFVTQEEYSFLKNSQLENGPSQSCQPSAMVWPQGIKQDKPSLNEGKIKETGKRHPMSHGRRFGSVDWNIEMKQFKSALEINSEQAYRSQKKHDENMPTKKKDHDSLSKTEALATKKVRDEAFGYISTLYKSHSQPDISKGKYENKKRSSTVSGVPGYARQRSCEFRSSNVVGIEHGIGELDECRKEWVIVGNIFSSDERKMSHKCREKKDHREMRELQSRQDLTPEDSKGNRYHASSNFRSTASLMKSIKRITAHSQDILEAISRQADMNNDLIECEDEQAKSRNDLLRYENCLDDTATTSHKTSMKGRKTSTSSQKTGLSSLCLSHEREATGHTKDGTQTVNMEVLSDLSDAHLNKESETVAGSASQLNHPDGNLIKLDLYVQEISNTLLFLFMENDSLNDNDTILDMVKNISSPLQDLDHHLSQISAQVAMTQDVPLDYNYLTYNSYTKNLSGQISMSPGVLQPLSHQELDFCQTAIAMHDEFQKSPERVDITLRNYATCVYGHRAFSQEVYFQPKQCKPPRGMSPARDTVMCLGDVARQCLFGDKGITIL